MGLTFHIVMRSGPTPGKVFPLEKNEIYIGRDLSNDLVINDPEISRRHSRLLFQNTALIILEDLGSTNGTSVNGQRLVSPYILNPGEVITLGERITLLYEAVDTGRGSYRFCRKSPTRKSHPGLRTLCPGCLTRQPTVRPHMIRRQPPRPARRLRSPRSSRRDTPTASLPQYQTPQPAPAAPPYQPPQPAAQPPYQPAQPSPAAAYQPAPNGTTPSTLRQPHRHLALIRPRRHFPVRSPTLRVPEPVADKSPRPRSGRLS